MEDLEREAQEKEALECGNSDSQRLVYVTKLSEDAGPSFTMLVCNTGLLAVSLVDVH